ncbi:pyruvate phosphate dikinase [Nocardiopsis tropica]|uniref:Pyruvate phosphate dikinase n=1 Tax=Nocardiopsis tropica TaxID=109330 RepID=A0ABU7KXI9_9ACTN|nr:pyruvate phosphate dikinase [Nocardiopsis umidischolae]MEE2053989.1 pyruvate phosphate dikinase [Nocardiopsis umidischolae]
MPPALCLLAEDLFRAMAEAVNATNAWLRLYRPRRVVLRTSAHEDLAESAQAGRTVSLLNCPPDASALLRTIDQDLLTTENLGGGSGACIMVQEQIEAPLYGVAFYEDGHLTVEATRHADGITAGRPPQTHTRVEGNRLHITTQESLIPGMLLTRRLLQSCRLLHEHFGFGVDVEWAWTGAAVVVLQVRPITRSLLERAA